ncbi:hypothetical protein [Virgibacillus necropolis]|nr:hypothetical protein [Virgibacillus necropolis]
MNYMDQYISLVQEFKQKLDRELTNEEYEFIVWLAEQQANFQKIPQCS